MVQEKDVDIMGYKRGAHQDGVDICKHYVFDIPGRTPGLFGWNDTCAVWCKRCGKRETEHVVIRGLPEFKPEKPKFRQSAPPQAAVQQHDPNATRMLDAAREQQINRDMNMLDAWNDPLSVGAQRHEAPPPPPPEAPPLLVAPVTAKPVAATSEDPSSDAFKAEVERMVREEIAKEERERASNGEFKASVDEMIKSTVAPDRLAELNAAPPGAAASVSELLRKLELEQYIGAFEAEALELPVLISLARSDGKVALDEALKEVGVKSIGHRLKIFTALQ